MKVAIIYWSDTGNTEEMAHAFVDGVHSAGAEAEVLRCVQVQKTTLEEYDAFAFGCPAMGDEELEETTFEPMFSRIENGLKGRRIALFGSYGWGDGQWMRDWEKRAEKDGAVLVTDCVIANEYPSDEKLEECRKAGALLAKGDSAK